MFKKLLLTTVLFYPILASANEQTSNSNAIVSLRYSEASVANETNPIFGVGFMTIKGKGKFGVSFSADLQQFDQKGKQTDIGREKEEYKHTNVMIGSTYGVTQDFYLATKIGITYSKYYNYYKGMNDEMTPIMQSDVEDGHGFSYGLDLIYLKGSVALGAGVANFDYFDDRETKLNFSIGYKF